MVALLGELSVTQKIRARIVADIFVWLLRNLKTKRVGESTMKGDCHYPPPPPKPKLANLKLTHRQQIEKRLHS
jgi:hypothetical protein